MNLLTVILKLLINMTSVEIRGIYYNKQYNRPLVVKTDIRQYFEQGKSYKIKTNIELWEGVVEKVTIGFRGLTFVVVKFVDGGTVDFMKDTRYKSWFVLSNIKNTREVVISEIEYIKPTTATQFHYEKFDTIDYASSVDENEDELSCCVSDITD